MQLKNKKMCLKKKKCSHINFFRLYEKNSCTPFYDDFLEDSFQTLLMKKAILSLFKCARHQLRQALQQSEKEKVMWHVGTQRVARYGDLFLISSVISLKDYLPLLVWNLCSERFQSSIQSFSTFGVVFSLFHWNSRSTKQPPQPLIFLFSLSPMLQEHSGVLATVRIRVVGSDRACSPPGQVCRPRLHLREIALAANLTYKWVIHNNNVVPYGNSA